MTGAVEKDGGGARGLQECPDWIYLLREFDLVYRNGSDGGSKAIRAHRKRVRDALSRVLTGETPVAPRQAAAKPVTAQPCADRGELYLGRGGLVRERRGGLCARVADPDPPRSRAPHHHRRSCALPAGLCLGRAARHAECARDEAVLFAQGTDGGGDLTGGRVLGRGEGSGFGAG